MARNIELLPEDDTVDLTKNRIRHKQNSKGKQEKTIQKRYEKLKVKREPFLSRAREFSTYTLPNLYPEVASENQGSGTNTTGWQSFGAQCVNNLENKLIMTLFPPHSTFARLELTQEAKKHLREGDEDLIEAQGGLVQAEQAALMEHEHIAGRVGLGEAMEHLLIGGTTCLYMPEEGNLVNYPLDRFVNRRDKSGTLLELIIEESKGIDTFEPALQAIIKAKMRTSNKYKEKDDEEVKLYTRAVLKQGFYHIEQEVVGEKVGKSYRVKPENFPFIVLRWKTNYGEDYGRSLVEQYANDFHMVQFLSEALGKGMILMADIKYLIKPGSVTDVDHLIESPTGEFIFGNIDDIGVLQLEKYADFTPIANVLEKYERRLGTAFMLGAAVQRNAERVTAYEIRRDAIEMEQNLGGAYSLLANTLQRPYFNLLLRRIGFDLPKELVNTVLITGISALSKMTDADKLMQFTEMLNLPASWPMPAQERMLWADYMRSAASQLSLETPWIMTEDQYQKQQEQRMQAQQQEMMMQGAANAMPQVANNLTQRGK
ncbi:portal (connector) protein [Vibrio phage vB_ValA_R15Z]|uniref:Portal (Connector) protein n=1 Tax=Vibrio phage vB_ValA_R15Z TaxID=3044218 RepID=A0AA49XC50_9CAUD|nr:portal (connector) protein [Vibrio phage vB_ValA_R15Z]